VREWEALVEREPRVIKLADAVLRNHVPELLEELAEWMARTGPPGTRMRAAAIAHAAHRVDQAFQLTQLIHEVRLLRMTILRLLLAAEAAEQVQAGTQGMADRVTELARLNAGLDFVITDAVEYFVNERERRLAEMAKREADLWRESDQRKSDFLAVLSHELRNPLAPIRNGLYILDRAQPGSDQASRAMDVIHRQTEHLTRLVDDLLDATRISRGKIQLHRERFDLRDVVRRTCDDLRSVFEQRELDLRLDVPAGPIWNEGQASLRVRDNGVGLEASAVERIFEPFVQLGQDWARKEGGLGLGLALVKGLASLHGGSVSARSSGLGRGSEFVVELPLALPPPRGQPLRASLPPRRGCHARCSSSRTTSMPLRRSRRSSPSAAIAPASPMTAGPGSRSRVNSSRI